MNEKTGKQGAGRPSRTWSFHHGIFLIIFLNFFFFNFEKGSVPTNRGWFDKGKSHHKNLKKRPISGIENSEGKIIINCLCICYIFLFYL